MTARHCEVKGRSRPSFDGLWRRSNPGALPLAPDCFACARNDAMLSPLILVTAVLNGLMTGAVYALVALGLTLDLRRLAHHQFRPWRDVERGPVRGVLRLSEIRARPLSRGVSARAAVLRARLRAAALRHRAVVPRRRPQHAPGDARPRRLHRERAPLRVPRQHPHHRSALRLQIDRSRFHVPRHAARDFLRGRLRRRLGAVAHHDLDRHRQGHPRRRQGKARRRNLPASTSRISTP